MRACVCVWVFGGVLLGLFLGAGNASGLLFSWFSNCLFWGVGVWVGCPCFAGGMLSGFGAVRPGAWFLLILGPLFAAVYCCCGCCGGGGFGFGGCGWVGCELYSGREHLCFLCVLLWFVFLSVRWMPWHQGPMKDVVVCDKPRGAG